MWMSRRWLASPPWPTTRAIPRGRRRGWAFRDTSRAVHGRAHGRQTQPCHQGFLRAPAGRWQAAKGGPGRLHAQAADRDQRHGSHHKPWDESLHGATLSRRLLIGLAAGPAVWNASKAIPVGTGQRMRAGSTEFPAKAIQPAQPLWKDSRLLMIGIIIMAMALAEGAANDWLPLLMVDGHGFAPTSGSMSFAGFAAGMTVGDLQAVISLLAWDVASLSSPALSRASLDWHWPFLQVPRGFHLPPCYFGAWAHLWASRSPSRLPASSGRMPPVGSAWSPPKAIFLFSGVALAWLPGRPLRAAIGADCGRHCGLHGPRHSRR